MNRFAVRLVLGTIAIALLIFGVARIRTSDRAGASPVDYGRVPDFNLTESSGRAFTMQELSGKVWIADFIFTSCAGTCPMMSGQMRKLQGSLPRDVQFVSFTVDPARDTPAVLSRYAKEFAAESSRWFFLTGDRQELYDLCIKGFKLALDDSQGSDAEPITHSSRFVLVDRSGQIRGYYSGTENADLGRLAEDAKKLL